MGLVAIASLVVSIIGVIKSNNAWRISSTVNNRYQTIINPPNGEIKNSRSSAPDELVILKGILILIFLIVGLYFYFSYFRLSFIVLSFINLVCIISLFIFSITNKKVSYIKYLNVKLVTLTLTSVYIFISQFKTFIPKGFDVKLLSSDSVDFKTIGTFIVSSIKIGIDGVKYIFFVAPFDISCFLINRLFFLMIIIVYFIDIFITIYKMSKEKYTLYSNTKLTINIILFNSICLILVINIMYKVIPYLQAAFSV